MNGNQNVMCMKQQPIIRSWYQHPDPIWFYASRNLCNLNMFNVMLKVVNNHTKKTINTKHHDPLRATLYHCLWSTHTNRPIEVCITNQRALKTVIDALVNAKLLDFKTGMRNKKTGYFYNSKFQPTAKFELKLIKYDIPLKNVKHVRQIVTKDSGGNIISRKTIGSKTKDGKLIQEYNDFIKGQDIRCAFKMGDFYTKRKKHPKTGKWIRRSIRYNLISNLAVNSQVARIFTDKIGTGGRLYNQDSLAVQQFPKVVRPRITINDNPTIELDFDELHPNMCYHTDGLNPPVTNYAFYPNDPLGLLRKCAKKAFNTLMNASTAKEALRSITKTLYCDNPMLGKTLSAEYGAGMKPRKCIIKMCIKIVRSHIPIKKYFCSGAWKTLQYEDSKMMLEIITELRQMDIVALPIHDSVIIENKHAATAKRIMQKVYMRHYGFSIGVS